MSQDFKFIVRFEGTDLDGNSTIHQALSNVKGIGKRLSYATLVAAGIDAQSRVGFLSDGDYKKIKDVLDDPLQHGIPSWMLNRQKDINTGKDIHLMGSDLFLANKDDIDREKKLRSWRGIRHTLGLKVRGQRTKTTGRTGRTMGVSRKTK